MHDCFYSQAKWELGTKLEVMFNASQQVLCVGGGGGGGGGGGKVDHGRLA